MKTETRPSILCVDDEMRVLEGVRRTLGRSFDVEIAAGGKAGLKALEDKGPFTAIISDLRMPHVDGIAVLGQARARFPNTVRILLTGYTDLSSALAAMNQGAVFRVLPKPCSPSDLLLAAEAAVEQHFLITAQQSMMEQTVRQSIGALTEVLAMVNPAGFGRATRAKSLAAEFAACLGRTGCWQLEVAAMLSQVGTITLPPETVEKLYSGARLSFEETLIVERLPKIASELVGSVPRMEEVRTILRQQSLRFDGTGGDPRTPRGEDIHWGARLLKIVIDLDILEAGGMDRSAALRTLREREGWYDRSMLHALAMNQQEELPRPEAVEIDLSEARPGTVFAEDVKSVAGVLLIARGQEVTEQLMARIRSLHHLLPSDRKVQVVASTESRPKQSRNASAPDLSWFESGLKSETTTGA